MSRPHLPTSPDPIRPGPASPGGAEPYTGTWEPPARSSAVYALDDGTSVVLVDDDGTTAIAPE